jgi:transcriptional/translational regulatory protein YebC/TACO1
LSENKILVGVIEINEAKRLRDKLFDRGVQIDLIHNEQTCRKGCQSRVEVWVEAQHLQQVQELFQEEVKRMIETEGTGVNHEQIGQVFDPEAKTTICPACGTEFSTELKECPDCGLVFFGE